MSETAAPGALAGALAKVQGDMPSVHKGKTADTGKYRYSYADLASVAAAIMPLLAQNGLAFVASPRHVGDGNYELVGSLMHTSGEQVDGALPLFGRDMQSLGSSISYGRRYLLGCLTGVVTDDDDDGAGATNKRTSRRTASQAQAPQQQPPAADPWATSTAPPPDDAVMLNTSSNLAKRMYASINDAIKAGQIVEDGRLPFIGSTIGRDIESTKQMTETEAKQVLARLDEMKEAAK